MSEDKTCGAEKSYKVKIWVEDDCVRCCSGVCDKGSCARFAQCKDVLIRVFSKANEGCCGAYKERKRIAATLAKTEKCVPDDKDKPCRHYHDCEAHWFEYITPKDGVES